MRLAIIKPVSPNIQSCVLTHLKRQVIDVALAIEQHREYEFALEKLGCKIQRLLVEPSMPDSVFIEDTAVVLDEIAIITRPGAISRRPEVKSVAAALDPYRPLAYIQAPGILDGGDVLRIGKTLYVGLSDRTNISAIAQLRECLSSYHYQIKSVDVRGCLHLKSAVTQVAQDILLINREWIDSHIFDEMTCIDIASDEPFAANALLIGDTVIYPTAFTRTRQKLQENGINVLLVNISEIAKAEGAVTCCSIVMDI